MITFSRLGRLGRWGNQLFEYAGTRLYAHLNQLSWAMPPWEGVYVFNDVTHWTTAEKFRSAILPTVQLADMRSTSWPERIFKPLGMWQHNNMHELWQHPRDNINLYGYLQDVDSLQKLREHRELVRNWLQFHPRVDSVMRTATNQYPPWVGVHIRRGDLVKRNLTIPVAEYLKVLPGIIGQRRLFVASDDPSTQKELTAYHPFAISYRDLPFPPHVADFWMLAHADTIVAGGSTFAWWAAYLNAGDYWSTPLTHQWDAGHQPHIEQQKL